MNKTSLWLIEAEFKRGANHSITILNSAKGRADLPLLHTDPSAAPEPAPACRKPGATPCFAGFRVKPGMVDGGYAPEWRQSSPHNSLSLARILRWWIRYNGRLEPQHRIVDMKSRLLIRQNIIFFCICSPVACSGEQSPEETATPAPKIVAEITSTPVVCWL